MNYILNMMGKQWINVPKCSSDLPISALCGSCHCLQVLRKQVNPGQLSEFPWDFLGSFSLALGSYFSKFSYKPNFPKTDGAEGLLLVHWFHPWQWVELDLL